MSRWSFNYMLFNGINIEERKLLMGDVRTILNKVLKEMMITYENRSLVF